MADSDNLTGGKRADRFVFEQSLALNDVDVITDFSVRGSASPYDPDVLDLSLALGRNVRAKNINDYVQVLGDQLYVDLDGTGAGAPELWATLTGVQDGDQLKVRTKRLRSWIKAQAASGSSQVYLSFDSNGLWYDYDKNGLYGGSDAYVILGDNNLVSGCFSLSPDVDLASQSVTIRFVGINQSYGLDLAGFGSDDKIVLDTKTKTSTWLSLIGNANSIYNRPMPAGGPTTDTYHVSANKNYSYAYLLKGNSYAGYDINPSGSGYKVVGSYSQFATQTGQVWSLAKGLPASFAVEFITPSYTTPS